MKSAYHVFLTDNKLLITTNPSKSDEQGRKCTEVLFCGGLPRSSVEVSVMDMERRG